MSNYNYCIATHPDKPNDSANSRGRKYHLTTDKQITLCKFKVTQLIGSQADVFDGKGMSLHNGLHWSPTQYRQGLCGSCKQVAKQTGLQYKLMEY